MEEIVEKLRRAVEDSKLDPMRSCSENNVGYKQFDPKSVLVMKEKLMAAHKRSMERKAERELAECTFHPTITRRSAEIVAAKPSLLGPLHEPKATKFEILEDRIPSINPVSRALASQRERPGPIHERLIQFADLCREKLETKRAEKMLREESLVSSVPQINRNSHDISRRRTALGIAPAQTLDRLTDYDLQMREARRQRQEALEEEKLRKATQPLTFLTDNSRRILDRSAPSSRAASPKSPAPRSRCPSAHGASPVTPPPAAAAASARRARSVPRPGSRMGRADPAAGAGPPEEFQLRRRSGPGSWAESRQGESPAQRDPREPPARGRAQYGKGAAPAPAGTGAGTGTGGPVRQDCAAQTDPAADAAAPTAAPAEERRRWEAEAAALRAAGRAAEVEAERLREDRARLERELEAMRAAGAGAAAAASAEAQAAQAQAQAAAAAAAAELLAAQRRCGELEAAHAGLAQETVRAVPCRALLRCSEEEGAGGFGRSG